MMAASARMIVITWFGFAPIARNRPTSRWRSRTIAENNSATRISRAASWNTVNTEMPTSSVLECLPGGGEHDVAVDDLDVRDLRQRELDLLRLCSRRKLQQEGRNPVEHQVGRADAGVAHAGGRSSVFRLRR